MFGPIVIRLESICWIKIGGFEPLGKVVCRPADAIRCLRMTVWDGSTLLLVFMFGNTHFKSFRLGESSVIVGDWMLD